MYCMSSFAATVHKVLVVVAMEKEAAPIITLLNLQPTKEKFADLPMQAFHGNYNKIEILLVENGVDPVYKVQNIGTQAATLSTYLGISSFHPDLVVSIGTAGGVKPNGAQLRDIYISEQIHFYDRRISGIGYQEYGLGGFKSAIITMDNREQVKKGVICSGDSFDENKTDYDMFIKLHCAAIDMEAAGVAWVSMLTHTPMIAMKGITNFVRGPDIHQQYEQNVHSVSNDLAKELKVLLSIL